MKLLKKIVRDLASTFYDDQNFKVMSLPRVMLWASGIAIIISWISDQFFGFKYAGMNYLVIWAGTCAGAYGVKKVAEKDKNPNPPQEGEN